MNNISDDKIKLVTEYICSVLVRECGYNANMYVIFLLKINKRRTALLYLQTNQK